MPRYIRLLGWFALLLGAATAIFSTQPGIFGLLSLPMMFMGLGLSTLYLMLSTRHRVEHGYIHPGYIGMLLSSVPLILFIWFNVIN
jgi:hypothetical protein